MLVSIDQEISGTESKLVAGTVFALVVEEAVGVLIPGDGLDLDAA